MSDEVRNRRVGIEDWLWIKMIGFRAALSIASRACNRNVLRVQGKRWPLSVSGHKSMKTSV